jgi:protein gp37
MSDIEYWNRKQTQMILDNCGVFSQHTFMFLSKNTHSYDGFNWPINTMQGLTFPCGEATTEMQQLIIHKVQQLPRPFVSIEPLIGTLKTDITRVEIVIVGAMTGPSAIVPEKCWIDSIKRHIPGDKIHWKNNIVKYL